MSIHSTAIIDPAAQIDPSALIGPYVVIAGAVSIAADCELASGVIVYGPTSIGPRTRIHSHAVVGDIPQDRAFHGGDSSVRIGADCIIREGATIHRGSQPGSQTIIGDRCFLMTNSHVGHNCMLADDVTMISGSLLGGYVDVGTRAVISGNAAVHQFVRVGELAMISGLGKIVQDIPPFFMTDQEGALVGVNRVGMLRSGMSTLERDEIKAAYRVIYRSGLGRVQVAEMLSAIVKTAPGQRLIDFLAAKSKRGIAPPASQVRVKASGEPAAAPAADPD
jgi:UDP-N-acetylglucosamine acyltransferase